MIVSTLVLMLASAGIQESAAAPAETTQRPARERRVCRSVERVGTILPTRVCRPASYWTAVDAQQRAITQRDTDHMRNNSRSSLWEGTPK